MTFTSNDIDFKKYSKEIINILKKYPRLLIYIKGSPDPDAIAGSFVLKKLCELQGNEGTIISPQEASLPQNIKIIRDLHLPILFKQVEECKKNYDAYAILDHQSVLVENITGILPCAIHIDHHEPIEEEIPVEIQIQTEAVNSTSTIMLHLLKALQVDFENIDWHDAATALYYGIQTDTDDFLHVGELDQEAIQLISPYINKSLLSQINSLPFSKETLLFFQKALKNRFLYKDWLFSGVGYISEKHRDSIGIIGDFLLKRKGIDMVVVFALVEKENRLMLDASFRTKKENLNLNTLIKQITKEGGARRFKGAFQVELDYFLQCPDRDLLWKTVYITTIETLKKQRDKAFANDIQKFFEFLKNKIHQIFD